MFNMFGKKKETRSNLKSLVNICKKENKTFEADPFAEMIEKQKKLMEELTKFELA